MVKTVLFWKPNLTHLNDWHIHIEPKNLKLVLNKIDGIDQENIIFESDICYLWNASIRTSKKNTVSGNQHGAVHNITIGNMTSHRLIYMLTYGIPNLPIDRFDKCPCESGKNYQNCCRPEIRHRCKQITESDNNGLCVNPLHLELGDHHSNMHDIRVDGTGKGKIHIGNNHPRSIITEDKAREIWNDIQNKKEKKYTLQDIADIHGVKKSFIKDISCGRTWNHITGIPTKKRIDNVKLQKEKAYTKECIRRRKVLESKDIPYFGDYFEEEDLVEKKEEETTKICKGPLCIKQNPEGLQTPIEDFPFKTKEKKERRPNCKQCKLEQQRIYRQKKRKAESQKENTETKKIKIL